MRIKALTIIVAVVIAFIIGYDIRRADTGTFTVIKSSENHPIHTVLDLRVNLNTASEEELCELEGIGPSLAKRIIEYRTLTPFTKIEELMNVKGIGEKKFLAVKDSIIID